ncbi:MAG: hypothetical protein QOI40_4579, partial [Alphaproteobacteria bacterium]|nr:hypothetical protein [Alphaproteobacteria bacterium]
DVHEWEDAANGREKDHGGLGSPSARG